MGYRYPKYPDPWSDFQKEQQTRVRVETIQRQNAQDARRVAGIQAAYIEKVKSDEQEVRKGLGHSAPCREPAPSAASAQRPVSRPSAPRNVERPTIARLVLSTLSNIASVLSPALTYAAIGLGSLVLLWHYHII